MEKKYISPFYESLYVVFVPFLIVLFIEFVLKFGLGPFENGLSIFSAVYASIVAICFYVWIKKSIIFAFFPIVIFSIIIVKFFRDAPVTFPRFFCTFISLLILSFFSVIGYAFSMVIRRHSTSYSFSILQFLVGLFIFVCGMVLVYISTNFCNPDLSLVMSLLAGIKEGLPLGCGVSVIIVMLSQKGH